MTPFNPTTALAYWREALKHEFGIGFTFEGMGPHSLMNRMYDARKASGDPELDTLTLRMLEDGKTVWIFRKEVQLED